MVPKFGLIVNQLSQVSKCIRKKILIFIKFCNLFKSPLSFMLFEICLTPLLLVTPPITSLSFTEKK